MNGRSWPALSLGSGSRTTLSEPIFVLPYFSATNRSNVEAARPAVTDKAETRTR